VTVSENEDYFSLFQLPVAYAINTEELIRRYQKMIARVHPDNFPLGLEAEKKWAEDYSACLNQAYIILSCPVKRANYLLTQMGFNLELETDTSMSAEFLMQQMEWQELILEAKSSNNKIEIKKCEAVIQAELLKRIEAFELCIEKITLDNLADINKKNIQQAREIAREMIFLNKLVVNN
jgi:molecular chaperone HscB